MCISASISSDLQKEGVQRLGGLGGRLVIEGREPEEVCHSLAGFNGPDGTLGVYFEE